MNSKSLMLFVLLFFGGVSSCCEEPTLIYVAPEKLITSHMNNEGPYPVAAETNVVPAKAYVMRAWIKMDAIRYVDQEFKKKAPFQIGMSAKADGCYDFKQINEHWVEGWDVYTLNDFDASHPAGSKVTDHFELYSTRCIYTEMSAGDEVMQLALYATPEQNEQQFILDVYFNNGIILRDTSSVVWLN